MEGHNRLHEFKGMLHTFTLSRRSLRNSSLLLKNTEYSTTLEYVLNLGTLNIGKLKY